MTQRALFISDLHLSPSRPQMVAALHALLQGPARGAAALFAMQHDLAAKTPDRVDLQLWRCRGHDDDGAALEVLGAQRHALRVVAGRGADHALGQLRR